MPKTILELKKLWEREKEEYKLQEVGSGVQKFVKRVFNCPQIFNLQEGNLATSPLKRKNEFLEEKSKKNKKADVIIFVDADRVIPVEVEKYTNIEAGVKQLFDYQLVWDKKYGILTDGKTWRFYNNNILIKEFTIDHIFNRTSEFLTFWKEYIQLANYYLSFFEKIGQIALFEEDISVGNKRIDFFKDITTVIDSFKNKLNIKGYFDRKGDQQSEKRAVEITYAYIIQFILFKTLVDNDYGEFKKDFKDRIDNIYRGLKNKSYKEILTTIKGISHIISKNVYRPFSKEQEFINKTLEEILTKAKSELTDVTPWLDIFIFIKRYSFKNVHNEIFGFIYENYLKDLYSDEQKGQYFTDPAIVNFMLHQVDYTSKEIKKLLKRDKDSISLIDPACGSGTFLYSATSEIINAIPNGSEVSSDVIEQLVNNNIFGLDIAEFPLYLAEMNIIMRLLPLIINEEYNNPIDKKIKVFKTNDSISEFLDTALRNTENDIKVNNNQMKLFHKAADLGYVSYMREETDLEDMKKSLENQPRCNRYRFDYVIGNPPYVTYNECSKQGLLIVKHIQNKTRQMSDIYGVNLNTVPGRIKAYAPKPNLYAFFIALGLALLKDNGRLCYIIPQTILTSSDLDVLRYHLAKFTTIEKIITFSGRMFIGRGIKQDKPIFTSSLILIVNRTSPEMEHQVQIINHNYPTDDMEKCLQNIKDGEKVFIKKVSQKELLERVANWNFIKQDKKISKCLETYNQNETLDIYRMPKLSQMNFSSIFYFDKGLVFAKNKICSELKVSKDTDYYNLIRVEKDKYKLSLTHTVIKKKDISFPKGAQGFDVYDRKYKIVWSYMNSNRFYFTDEKIMISFNWVLISSDNKKEMLYILSLLNSAVNKFVYDSLLKSESEKDILIGIKTIKEFIRVPKINRENQFIKDEIIKCTDNLLEMEDIYLSDLVDFSGIMIQKFNDIAVNDNYLVLIKDKEKYKCPIMKKRKLVENTIGSKIKNKNLIDENKFILSEIKSLRIIDHEQQQKLKNYIDDLIFALYFSIDLDDVGLDKADKINALCRKNEYFSLLSN